MDFLKKHYEKILLGVVLLGLVGAMVFLPFMILHDRNQLDETRTEIIIRPVKPLAPLDLTAESNTIRRMQLPARLDLETTNRLFNPVQWQKAVDGSLIKIESGNEVGPGAVVVTRISPLYFILTLDAVQTNEFGARYIVGVERQAEPVAWKRTKRQHYASLGDKNDAFTITSVQGPPADPTQLILQLTDTGETVSLSKAKPFRRVDAYMADLKYGPEGKTWSGQRVGDDLKFYGDDYIIVAINQNEVVLSAKSNQKKTTLIYNSK
ncbi:MAG TPA: hypothetical protein VMJ12_17135 [Candidatus Acidoferrales bacterium]|nr:hypothetical protein [Candidatus Acidoferrales bacterium]